MLPLLLAVFTFFQFQLSSPAEDIPQQSVIEGPLYLSTTLPTASPVSVDRHSSNPAQSGLLTVTQTPTQATPINTAPTATHLPQRVAPTSTPAPQPTPSPQPANLTLETPTPKAETTNQQPATPNPETATSSQQPQNQKPETKNPKPETQNPLRVPILMYHYISVPPKDADIYRLDLSVTPENLDAQLGYLKNAGFNVISLDDLLLALKGETELPPKPVVLTFDDGYRDNYLYAFPLLKKYGFSATFSLVTQYIDQNNPNHLSWEQVTEMHQAGMDFAAHSYSHADLKNKDVDFLVYQILGSKEAIEERIKEPLHFFTYPSGSYDQLTIDVIASANFWGALTTQEGSLNSYAKRFEIRRVRIRGADTLEKFIERVQP